LYLHGGVYVLGDAAQVAGLAAQVGRRASAKVISADYRLAPEHQYPPRSMTPCPPTKPSCWPAQRPAGQATRVPRTTDHRRPATGGDDHEQPGVIMSTSITELIDSFYEAFCGKTELLDAVLTDDWDDIPLGPGQEPGRAGARHLIEGLNKAFSDFRTVVEEIIDARGEEGNGMVGVRAKMRGVHTGEFFGIAPTGRETEVRTHDFHEIVDGRIIRTYHMEDWLTWFLQVQSWPSS
jgi:predicted ester cyclase